jgi:hypothetical protein
MTAVLFETWLLKLDARFKVENRKVKSYYVSLLHKETVTNKVLIIKFPISYVINYFTFFVVFNKYYYTIYNKNTNYVLDRLLFLKSSSNLVILGQGFFTSPFDNKKRSLKYWSLPSLLERDSTVSTYRF